MFNRNKGEVAEEDETYKDEISGGILKDSV
jgi:hypothetical protein